MIIGNFPLGSATSYRQEADWKSWSAPEDKRILHVHLRCARITEKKSLEAELRIKEVKNQYFPSMEAGSIWDTFITNSIGSWNWIAHQISELLWTSNICIPSFLSIFEWQCFFWLSCFCRIIVDFLEVEHTVFWFIYGSKEGPVLICCSAYCSSLRGHGFEVWVLTL